MHTQMPYEDFVKIVYEPEHSKNILLELQQKYNLDTMQFISWYREGIPLPVEARDCRNWLYNFEIFIRAEGDIFELLQSSQFDSQRDLFGQTNENMEGLIKNQPLFYFSVKAA
ncbi:hypothetical protein [Syntrophomonas palmitatica]|uniref:hypothetical protein n=1 Tax=Syntrophomonas palmitatica TaxID=402877 RepID=UPI0006D1791B|nr:hypothetical protein [Syntrophomonas palmitatica]